MKCAKVLWVMVVMALSVTAYADEITDSINEALQHYKDGKYSEAMTSLNYASQLIAQKKGGDLQSLLPKPIEGWTAEDATSQAAGVHMLGGGVSAERHYRKESASIKITIVTDSPMLQGVMMMFNNPMIATSDGGKMEKIGGEKAIVKYNAAAKDGDIKIVVANRFLVTVEGNDTSLEDMKAYAGAVDFKKLASIP